MPMVSGAALTSLGQAVTDAEEHLPDVIALTPLWEARERVALARDFDGPRLVLIGQARPGRLPATGRDAIVGLLRQIAARQRAEASEALRAGGMRAVS